MTTFQIEHTTPLTRSEVRRWALELLGRDLVDYARYTLTSQAKGEIVFTRIFRTTIVWIATVATFPLGLLFYVAGRRQDVVTVLIDKASDGTAVTVAGYAKRNVIEGIRYRVLEDLTFEEPATA